MVVKINQENQFIDFRLITQSRKNHVLSCFVNNLRGAFAPLCFAFFCYYCFAVITPSVKSRVIILPGISLPDSIACAIGFSISC
ncbi:hypothetical protein C4513_13850 [Morganella morganii]|nr:hypothetical protein [Morganella morganii]MQC11956.1 hypothetical protein [Morganella morganii]MQC15729.1 hypothetical protein [Morganella morganii]